MARFDRFGGRRQADPLGDLERSLETKEPSARQPRSPRRRPGAVSATGLRLLGAMTVIAFALLAVSTIMLWRIADQTATRSGGDGDRSAEPPPLPPASRDSSTHAMTRELDQLSETFVTQLQGLNAQLGAAAGAPAALEQQFSGATQSLDQLASQAGTFEGADRSLAKVARSTGRLAAVQTSLRRMRGDLSELEKVAGNTDAMQASIATMNDQLRTLEAVNAQMQSMNTSLQTLGPMNASLTTMTASLSTMTEQMGHMSATMDEICQAFQAIGLPQIDCPE